jgi:hypothetical protein
MGSSTSVESTGTRTILKVPWGHSKVTDWMLFDCTKDSENSQNSDSNAGAEQRTGSQKSQVLWLDHSRILIKKGSLEVVNQILLSYQLLSKPMGRDGFESRQ